jgi:hypothetical protein
VRDEGAVVGTEIVDPVVEGGEAELGFGGALEGALFAASIAFGFSACRLPCFRGPLTGFFVGGWSGWGSASGLAGGSPCEGGGGFSGGPSIASRFVGVAPRSIRCAST